MQAKSSFHLPPFPVSEDEYGYLELSTEPVSWSSHCGCFGQNKDLNLRFLTLTLVVLL